MNPIHIDDAGDALYQEVFEEHNGRTFAEVKEDGYRMQVHKKNGVIRAYTRSLNEIVTELFPELDSSFERLPDCILDCEITGEQKVGHEGFNIIQKRFRHKISPKGIEAYLKSGISAKMPVALRVFDTLYWENQPLIDVPLTERRKYTENISEKRIFPSTQRTLNSEEELKSWFTQLVSDGYEGLVCKNPASIYLSGKKTKDWIKVKRGETLDLAILGAFVDKRGMYELLLGTYNTSENRYESLCKVNAKTDSLDKEIYPLIEGNFSLKCPENVFLNPNMLNGKYSSPDFFVKPSVVLEVSAINYQAGSDKHSCGYLDGKSYSLRTAVMKRIRFDKPATEVTTSLQVKQAYNKFKGEE